MVSFSVRSCHSLVATISLAKAVGRRRSAVVDVWSYTSDRSVLMRRRVDRSVNSGSSLERVYGEDSGGAIRLRAFVWWFMVDDMLGDEC